MSRSVAILINSLRVGGAERQATFLACALQERGWQVRVATLLGGGLHEATLRAAGIPVEHLGHRKLDLPIALARAVAWVRRDPPTILCAFLHQANLVVRALGRPLGVPVVVSSERCLGPETPGRARIRRWTRGLDDAVVSNSQHATELLIDAGIVTPERAFTVWNALDTSRFDGAVDRPTVRAERLHAGPDNVVLLAVGNVRAQKDYTVLVDAFGRIADAHPEAVLRIAGRLDDDPAMYHRIRPDLWEQGRMRLLGACDDVPDLLRAADAVVLSSIAEGLPNALLEALAAARPVVATRVGGVPEVVPESAGILVPSGDPAAFARALGELLDRTPEAREAMGQAGYDHVTARFVPEAIADEWERLFEALCAARGVPA